MVVAIAACVVVVGGALTPSALFRASAETRTATPASTSPAAVGPTLIAAPDDAGTGTVCSSAVPCTLTTALRTAVAGSTVRLSGGSYGEQILRLANGMPTQKVVVRPQPGEHAMFERLTTFAPNVVWRGIRVTRMMYIKATAHGTQLNHMHFYGGGLFVRSNNVMVQNSLFENGRSLDGIQVARSEHVVIRHNTVRNYNDSGTSGYHADCIQLFDSAHISIHHNSLGNCYNAGIIFSGGSGRGIQDVSIRANFIRGCVVKSAACAGGTALDLRESSAVDIRVRNNTFAKGSVRLGDLTKLVFDRNIVAYLSVCDGTMTNSIVEKVGSAGCGRVAADSAHGMRMGTVAFRDVATGDLRLADPATARIDPKGGTPNPTDYDNEPMPATIAGAAAA